MKTVFKYFSLLLIVISSNSLLFAQNNFVVGYLPTYSGFPNSINNVDLDIVTHIDIAFANPNANGAISIPNGTATVVNTSHAKGVKVLLSIAGAGANKAAYSSVMGNINTMNTFIDNLVQLTIANNLDGIDVDIEGDLLDGTTITSAQYETFVLNLRRALKAENKLITAALGGCL